MAALAAVLLTVTAGCSAVIVNRQPDNHKAMEQLIERQPGVHTADVTVERSVNGITVAEVAALGVTPDGDKRWLITCDEHDEHAYTRTKKTALKASGLDFCVQCRERVTV